MNKFSIIINKFYKRMNIIYKIKNFLFYNDFDFFKLYIDFYVYFNYKIEILNFFDIKFIFDDI
jgi:hypothetical protein